MTAGPPPHPLAQPIRGYPTRLTDFMEALQGAYVRAVAAAAGCILSKPEIDPGVDFELRHKSTTHTGVGDEVARLEVQLKATTHPPGRRHLSAALERDRWDHFAVGNPSIHKIVVVMHVPPSPANWTLANPRHLRVHHAAYWVNLAGQTSNGCATQVAQAPLSQPFDDVALCHIMMRIGQGGSP